MNKYLEVLWGGEWLGVVMVNTSRTILGSSKFSFRSTIPISGTMLW